jgi:hypothetical protein
MFFSLLLAFSHTGLPGMSSLRILAFILNLLSQIAIRLSVHLFKYFSFSRLMLFDLFKCECPSPRPWHFWLFFIPSKAQCGLNLLTAL